MNRDYLYRDTLRTDLLQLAAGYSENAVMVTTAQLELPGPHIVYINTTFTKISGYSAHELIGKTPRILQGPETDRAILDTLKEELRKGNNFIARIMNYRRDGSAFEMEWIISHIRNENGETTHYIAIQRDITGHDRAKSQLGKINQDLRDMSQKLLQALQRLEKAERRLVQQERLVALETMAAGLAHDINNSLAPIIIYLDTIQNTPNVPCNLQQRLPAIQATIEHAKKLIIHLQNFCYQKKTDDSYELINLNEILLLIKKMTAAKLHVDTSQIRQPIELSVELHDNMTVLGNTVNCSRFF